MGNRNANEQNDDNNIRDNEQILIQNDANNPLGKIEPPSVKQIFAVRNPFSIKKTSLILEKDANQLNLFYIKFEYDSLYNFNCYINFEVSKNPSKKLNPKQITDPDDYVLAYNPSAAFESKKILIKNLPKGESVEFFEKEAVVDIEYFKSNKSEKKERNTFDMSIELVPIIDNENNINYNEIVFVSLCNFEQEEIEKHPHSLKIEQQKLKTYGMWIDLHDIYNSSLERGECLICCSISTNTIFLPCNHACTCNSCAHSLKMRNSPCPICKKQINDIVILEVDEKLKEINNEEKKEEIIDIHEDNINIINNNNNNEIKEENKENKEENIIENIDQNNNENNIDNVKEEKDEIINNVNLNNNIDNMDDEEKEKINNEHE